MNNNFQETIVQGKILFAEADDTIYIKGIGHITAALCTDLKQRLFDKFTETTGPKEIAVDLKDCSYMDSTFMGLLAGCNRRLEKVSSRKIDIYNASESSVKLLQSMELLKVLNISSGAKDFPDKMEELGVKNSVDPDLVLNTHENLMELSESNRKKFSTLHELLKQQIEDSK